jgi:GntR family transcriptional regulator
MGAAAEAPPDIASSLRLHADESLIYMERVRLADGKPVIYERRHVVAGLCPEMTRADAKRSLYCCWTEKCDLQITGAEEVIHAVNASKVQAAHLQIPIGAACFEILATGFVHGEKPLWHEATLYRADMYEFRNRIGGITASRSAMGRIKGS